MNGWIKEKGATANVPLGGHHIAELNLDDNTPATVTQETGITTAVAIEGYGGRITTVSSTLGEGLETAFAVTNSKVKNGDIVLVNVTYGGGGGPVQTWASDVDDGTFNINIANLHASADLDAVMVIDFIILKPAMRRLVFVE